MRFRETQPESEKHPRILARGFFQQWDRSLVIFSGRVQSSKVEDRLLVLRIDPQDFFKLGDRLRRAIRSGEQHAEIRQRTHELRIQTQRGAILLFRLGCRTTLIENHSEQTVCFSISWMTREDLARRGFCFRKSSRLDQRARLTQQRIDIPRSTLRRTINREREGKQK